MKLKNKSTYKHWNAWPTETNMDYGKFGQILLWMKKFIYGPYLILGSVEQ